MLALWHENDRYSFEDSDRFEEDSLCTWSSEPESACINWRGWRKPTEQNTEDEPPNGVKTLVELSAQCIALFLPYELVEREYPPVPEELQLRIAFWSFPDSEDDIRLYSCLANSNSDEFLRGQNLFTSNAIKDSVQIGFHLSANVHHGGRNVFNVAITFDRKKITTCNCTCEPISYWCSHVVAVCLHRIYCPDDVCLRAPVSESLSRLERDQLQKFAQYLISELPQQILPAAQRLLDSLLSSQPTAINSTSGAPDPTAGASVNEQTTWFLDEKTLHNNIKKSLIKFCVPSPLVISDVNILSQSVPPATAEWSNLLRPLRGREPEGLWNLLSIVREMFRRNDENALHLLEVLTEEAIACDQIMVWWFNTRVALHGGASGGTKHTGPAGNTNTASHACALLCDEMVTLWRLAALNPSISPDHKTSLKIKFNDWQEKIFSRVMKHRNVSNSKSLNNFRQDTEIFMGFKPACEACDLDWEDYPLAGITYGTNCCCDEGSCVHIKRAGTATHFMGDHINWNECSSSTRGNSTQICLDECFLDLKNNRHLHFGNRTRTEYRSRTNMPMIRNHMPNNENRAMTNVYWVHMPRNISLPPPDDENASSNTTSPEEFSTNESLNAPASCANYDALLRSSPLPSTPHQTNSTCNTSSESQSSDEGDRTAAQKSTSSQTTPPSDVDEYNFLYFYDPKHLASTSSDFIKKTSDDQIPSTSKTSAAPITPLVKLDAEWETMFARSEGLYGYGHTNEACVLCVKLVDQFLKNPPNFIIEIPPSMIKGKRKKINPVSHHLSTLASEILQKCYFLCSVLAERKEYYLHAFKIGLYGLEMPRLPASTKPLEVKMAHQEGEILNHLKRMLPLGKEQVSILQNRAKLLREGQYKTRGESLLPLNLASLIFECLAMCQSPTQDKISDETLGFEASVAALGMKANVSEAEHPLLCEGIRRQRGDLATNILIRYKNNPTRLALAMDKLLDREVHPFLQSAMDACWYQIRDPRNLPLIAMKNVANSNIHNQPLQCYNPNVTSVPGELDTNIAVMTLNPIPPQSSSSCNIGLSSHRKDNNRYKSSKRLYPSQPNQASEANAHYLFELGKTILSKVGGPIQTTVFSQPPLPTQPHRALHMCAFQLALYSLGLLNRVTPNWRSRNYSSQVTWIADHAMEVGAPATLFLLGTWDGHLTPTEIANIADRMSRSHERNTVEAAAQLALSCLKHSAALNPNEITRAIIQCKEQSDHMMEIACLTVEMAAKGGGVFPEVLFSVAKHWFDLYMRNSNPDEDNYMLQVDPREEFKCPYVYQANYSMSVDTSQQPPPPLYAHQLMVPPQTSPAHLYQLSYFPNQSIPQNSPPLNTQQPNTVMYYPYPSVPTSNQYSQYYSPYIQSPVQYQNANPQSQPQQGPPQYFVQPINQNSNQIRSPPQQAQANICPPPNFRQIHHLTSAYRVGLLALDTLARRVHEPNQAKYSRNPPFREDIQWLLRLSKKLGPNYTQQFCLAVTNSVVNPFTLHDVAMEAVMYMGHFNPSPNMCSTLSPLVEKCHSMYIQLLHQKLYQLSSADYEEYVGILYSAYGAFAMTPEGGTMFKDWLQSVRRSKSCKKELWTMITNMLPTT